MPFADLTDVRCYYELLGSGSPLLLIPGLGATSSMWDGVAEQLSGYFNLILPDNRGIGRSEPKRPARRLAELAVDLVELLDALQLDRAHVLGLSLGGVIAQQLAVDHPSRVDRLVLISCAGRFGPYLREMARLLGQTLRYFPQEVFLRTVELLGTAPEFLDAHPDLIDRKVARFRGGMSRKAIARQLHCLGCSEAVEGPSCITAPTLVIAAEHDTLIPSCYARQMARQIPDSQFILAQGCGHNPLEEKPEIIVPKIVEFLSAGSVSADSTGYPVGIGVGEWV